MAKEKALWEIVYQSKLHMDIIMFVGYSGTTYRQLAEKMEEWKKQFPPSSVGPAVYCVTTFEGENRCNVKPLEHVSLRPAIKKLSFQLLGPAPEDYDWYYRHPNGEPTPEHAEKMASIQKPPEIKEDLKRSKRKKR